jgi:hypothetical protein
MARAALERMQASKFEALDRYGPVLSRPASIPTKATRGVRVAFAEASDHAASAIMPELPLPPESGHFDVTDPAHPSWKRDRITARPSG